MKKLMQVLAITAGILSVAASGHATQYEITDVLGGTDNGFGFSGFHRAQSNGAMSGANWVEITGMVGTGSYDDVTHDFSSTFTVKYLNGPLDMVATELGTVVVTGKLDFGVDTQPTKMGNLEDARIGDLNAEFFSDSLVGPQSVFGAADARSSYNLTFYNPNPPYVNTANVPKPNSFDPGNTFAQMTLWGAMLDANSVGSGQTTVNFPYNANNNETSTLGMDLVLVMVEVPEPGTYALLGMMLGAAMYAKRRDQDMVAERE